MGSARRDPIAGYKAPRSALGRLQPNPGRRPPEHLGTAGGTSFRRDDIVRLQRVAGNAAVCAVIHRLRSTHDLSPEPHDVRVQRRFPDGSTNYRFDTHRVTEADLSDSEIVARFRSLPLGQLIQYRRRVSDPAVIDFINRAATDLLAALPLDIIFQQLKTEKDPDVRSFIEHWLDAYAPTSYEIAVGTNTGGSTPTSMTISGIVVSVLPDDFVDAAEFQGLLAKTSHGQATSTRGITMYYPKYRPVWFITSGKASSVKPTVQTLSIRTIYLRGTSRIGPSAYGSGTTKADKDAGRQTIAHHEGAHAVCFIQYLRAHAPPRFTGKKGDPKAQIEKKGRDFNAAMDTYYKDMAKHCGPSIDCIGTKASFCP